MPIVTLNGYIEVPDEDLDAVLAALPEHVDATKAEDGCIDFEVLQDKGRPNRFNVSEMFRDIESFEYHQERTASSPWAVLTANAVRHYEVTKG